MFESRKRHHISTCIFRYLDFAGSLRSAPCVSRAPPKRDFEPLRDFNETLERCHAGQKWLHPTRILREIRDQDVRSHESRGAEHQPDGRTAIIRRIEIVLRAEKAERSKMRLACTFLFLAASALAFVPPTAAQPRQPTDPAPDAVVRDVILTRTSGFREGKLNGCTAQDCTLAGTTIARRDVLYIGLHVAGLDVPVIRDAMNDEVHFTDRSVLSTRLLSIDAEWVITERTTYPRARVAWVYLAPPEIHGKTVPPASPPVATDGWSGSFKLHRGQPPTGYHHTITMDFAVSASPDGSLRGRATGRIEYTGTSQHEECKFTHEIVPAEFEMQVTGRRTTVRGQVDLLHLEFSDPGVSETVRTRCIRGYRETQKREFLDLLRLEASFDLLAPSGRVIEAEGAGPVGFTKARWEIHQAQQ